MVLFWQPSQNSKGAHSKMGQIRFYLSLDTLSKYHILRSLAETQ